MSDSFKIATYNIQHGTNSDKIVANITTLAQSGINIFCLQEVRHHPNKTFIVDYLLNTLGENWKAEYLISSKTFDLGLCTIWDSNKIECIKFDSVLLPKLGKIKLYEKLYLKLHRKIEKVDNKNINPETKAALIGEFNFKGKKIRITNTHLDWLGGVSQRGRQLEQIKDTLNPYQGNIFEVICGDFNTLGFYKFQNKIKKQINCLLCEGFVSAFENKPTTKSWQTMDHILVKNLEVIKSDILKLKGSDHYPLLAEIKI